MLNIHNTNIYLTRGDTAYIQIKLFDSEKNPFELQIGDVVRCQVKKQIDQDPVISGEIFYGETDVVWGIKPSDTSGLKPGVYFWDCELERENEDIFTFIPFSKFVVAQEVTRNE